jgi:hypothetical protein
MSLGYPAGALIVALAVLPLAAAQSDTVKSIEQTPGTDITFYGHIFDVQRGSPMPMNTQFPVGEDDFSRGWAGGCGDPPPAPDNSAECENWNLNENFWYTTAGFVQVKSADEWGGDYALFHNERGQTKDIFLDTSRPVTAYYYMSADFHGWPVVACQALCWNWDPGMFEDWVVEAWVWHANLGDWSTEPSSKPDMSKISQRSPDAFPIAHGKTTPRQMVSIDETIPGGTGTVNEFEITLEWDAGFDGRVPFQNDLIVEFEWYQETNGQKYILSSGPAGVVWNANSGEDWPARVILPVRNPMDVELVFPRFVHDKLVILSVINTPWGSYDIDPTLTKLTVKDAKGQQVAIKPETMQTSLDSSVAHSGHYKPINATWVWDYQAQGLSPGVYTITIETTNFQHTYTASTDATFTIEKSGKGGDTQAGRSGLQSFNDQQLEQFKKGAEGQVTPGETTTTENEKAKKDSPGLPLFALILVGAGMVLLRRRRA